MIKMINKYQHMLALFAMIVTNIVCDGQNECKDKSKLTLYEKTICKIDYWSCSNNTLTINQCLSHKCTQQVNGQCQFSQYATLSIFDCMNNCCGESIHQVHDYSLNLNQCFNLYFYPGFIKDIEITPQNNVFIIPVSIFGAIIIILIIFCIYNRHRIKQLLGGSRSQVEPGQIIFRIQEQKNNTLQQININDINYSFQDVFKQQKYDKDLQCTICLSQSNNVRTNCSHWFHFDCLNTWTKKSFHCPNCINKEINPITVYCKSCKKPYAEIKINKSTEYSKIQNLLNFFLCNNCNKQNNKN